MYIIILIWDLLGLIGYFFTYHTIRKSWYYEFDEDLLKTKYKKILTIISIGFPMWIICGLFSVICPMIMYDKKYWTLYFKIKKL